MKKSSREKLNLFFSAFLIMGYIVCTYFFLTLASQLEATPQKIITIAVFVIFGLLLFYATRVGDGVPVKRFSPLVLIIDIPCLYAILAYAIPGLPLNDILTSIPAIFMLAAVALGYGIPFTFLSGFELAPEVEEEEEVKAEEEAVEAIVEGGLAQDLNEANEEIEEVAEEVEEAEEAPIEEVEEEKE